jgi:hypothetical protein
VERALEALDPVPQVGMLATVHAEEAVVGARAQGLEPMRSGAPQPSETNGQRALADVVAGGAGAGVSRFEALDLGGHETPRRAPLASQNLRGDRRRFRRPVEAHRLVRWGWRRPRRLGQPGRAGVRGSRSGAGLVVDVVRDRRSLAQWMLGQA